MGLDLAIQYYGSIPKLAKALGIQRQSVYQWPDRLIPKERARDLEDLTGIPKEKLRPDLFKNKRKKRKKSKKREKNGKNY